MYFPLFLEGCGAGVGVGDVFVAVYGSVRLDSNTMGLIITLHMKCTSVVITALMLIQKFN